MFPKLGSTWRWLGKNSTNYGNLVGASLKQILASDAKAGIGAIFKSFGKTVAFTGIINLSLNLIENGLDLTDSEMWVDTVIDTSIGVGAYYLASGTMSLVTAGFAAAGFAVPGGVVVAGVILLSIGFDALIRWLIGYDD